MIEIQHAAIAIDLLGIVLGVCAIALALSLKGGIGGKVGVALTYFIWGIIWTIIAFIFPLLDLGYSEFLIDSLMVFGLDIHRMLTVVGIIFFILAAQGFARTMPHQD